VFLSLKQGLAFSTTSVNAWSALQNYFSTTSASAFLAVNQGNAFSTSSASNFLSLNQGLAFSTTSANVWGISQGYVTSSFSTTSAAYWLTLNQGNAFSTSSASAFLALNQGNAFSTTSATNFLSLNQGLAFSTTSANAFLTNATSTNFYATNGYDLCTGLGAPAGQALINALASGGSSADSPFYYTISSSAITITGYHGTSNNIVIPSSIDGYTVVQIGASAFNGATNAASVTIPNSVTNISDHAFYSCAGLTNVEIGSGVSTACMVHAAGQEPTELTCIEPFPSRALRETAGARLVAQTCQEVPLEFFSQLGEGDLLFIDSSHAVKVGSEVPSIYLEILPNLQPGVFIHFFVRGLIGLLALGALGLGLVHDDFNVETAELAQQRVKIIGA